MKKFICVILCIAAVTGAIVGGLTIANMVNEAAINEYIDSFAKVEYDSQLTPSLDEDGNYYFVTDGDFKVMQLTDIHLGGGCLSAAQDKKAINAVAAMISEEKPDLVILTGDMAAAYPNAGNMDNRYSHAFVARIMERLGVYWTVNFGNHDSEIYNTLTRSQVAQMYENETLKYCLFSRGPEDIYGEGHHVINVRNSLGLITKSFIMMDSNAYLDEDPLGLAWKYDNIHEDQIEWYRETVNSLNEYNNEILDSLSEGEKPENIEDYTTVQSMLFIHIPLMETRKAYDAYIDPEVAEEDKPIYKGGVVGEDAPYVYCSEIEEKMFETMIELGSTKAVYYGHDHLNNILLEYEGIDLCYGYSVDYFAYIGIDQKGAQRGCTVINCHPDTSYEIIHENYYQDKYKPLYEKEVVDMSN